jgi:hypothetical protein
MSHADFIRFVFALADVAVGFILGYRAGRRSR